MKTSTILFYLAILSAFILAISGCKDGDRRDRRDRDERPPVVEEPSPVPSTPPAFEDLNFRTDSGTGEGREPTPNTFVIPRCGSGKLGYVVTRWPSPLIPGTTMRIEYTFTQSDDAIVIDNEDRKSTPGMMALYFQRRGDDTYSEKYEAGYRQWSLARKALSPGKHTFEVVIDKGGWNFPNGFDAAARNVENVGFTLAGYGGPSAGHGVCMKQGTASLTITAFTVN